MISHRHRCIYVPVPRCASTSLRDWFIAHGGGRHTMRPHWYPGALPERMRRVLRALQLYPDYFAFTFVRDPLKRFVSLYLKAERRARARAGSVGDLEQFAALCAELLDDTRGLWGPPASAFFDRNAGRRYGPLGMPLGELRWAFGHVRPQVDFLPAPRTGRLYGSGPVPPLRFIGALETFQRDFVRLRERLGLPCAPMFWRNASAGAPQLLAALEGDAAVRRSVEDLYTDDFAGLGYGGQRRLAVAEGPRLPAGALPPAQPPRRDNAPAPRRLVRACFRAVCLEIGLEDRLRRSPPCRRLFAPLNRLRRRLAARAAPLRLRAVR